MTSKQSLGGQATAKISRAAALERYYQNPSVCKHCNKAIQVLDGQKIRAARDKIFCNSSCAASFNNLKPKRIRKRQPLEIRMVAQVKSRKKKDPNYLTLIERRELQHSRTKKDLFSKCKNWQSARSQLQKMARTIYLKSDKPKSCQVCGYDRHYEVCHLKAVFTFQETATLGEISCISNLIALCPTHHWEFDKGLLKLGSEPGNCIQN